MIDNWSTSHEEADTKHVMHALNAHAQDFERVVVNTRGTDIIILLIHHDIPIEVWMNIAAHVKRNNTYIFTKALSI